MNATIIFITIIIAILFLYYLVLTPWRRSKYKKIATDLNLKYVPEGFFQIGKIVGVIDGKELEIKNFTVPSVPQTVYYRTTISLTCKNTGLPFLILQKFFYRYPNWEGIFTRRESRKNSLFEDFRRDNAFIPVYEEIKGQIQNDFQVLCRFYNDHIKGGRMYIDENSITWVTDSLIINPNLLKNIIKFLIKIADNIEQNPVMQTKNDRK